MTRISLALGATLILAGCSLGGKAPDFYMTLDATQARAAGAGQTAAAGQTITVAVPTVARGLSTTRVPVVTGGTRLEYLTGVQWVEIPNTLVARLISETIAATTNRVVLDPKQFSFDPGTRLTGQLQSFGVDADRSEAVIVYDAALGGADGAVRTRRFESRVPVAAIDAATVPPALNQAANQLAAEVAAWVGG